MLQKRVENFSLRLTGLLGMSASKASTSRRRKVKDEDEEYVPDEPVEAVKKTRKARNSPIISSDPYNHRHHDPEVAILGVAVEGSIRHVLLSQVALSTHIIMWLHVRKFGAINVLRVWSSTHTFSKPNQTIRYKACLKIDSSPR